MHSCFLLVFTYISCIVSQVPFYFFWLLGDENANSSKWKESLIARTLARKSVNLMQLVYGQPVSNQASAVPDSSESEGSDDEDFFKPKGQADKVCPSFFIRSK